MGGGGIILQLRGWVLSPSLFSANVHRQIITCISPDDSEGGGGGGGSLLNYNRLNEQTM